MQRNKSPSRAWIAASLGGALGLAALGACGDDARECRVGADCASGACSPEGRCLPLDSAQPEAGDPEPVEAGGGDSSPSVDAQSDAGGGCVPNNDGVITRDEVPLGAGLYANYRIGYAESVSTAGTPRGDGKRDWDFSQALTSDSTVRIETQPLTGKWFESEYPGATYVAKLSQNQDALGIFETTPAALILRGVASSTDGITKTLLQHDPKVVTLAYPLTLDAEWSTEADVDGYYQGVLYTLANYTETYAAKVDAAGTLKTPLGSFEVLRVNTLLTRSINYFVTRIRTFSFVTECYGTIATVTSQDNESTVEFTNAAEIRRIAP